MRGYTLVLFELYRYIQTGQNHDPFGCETCHNDVRIWFDIVLYRSQRQS
jgi:hypothetical protein